MSELYEALSATSAIATGLAGNKVANFAYDAVAYANDYVDGVAAYDYTRNQNVPLASATDLDESVLAKGIRSQAASLPRNAINHIFGRASYNLNKVTDILNIILPLFKRTIASGGNRYEATAEYQQFDEVTMLDYVDKVGAIPRLKSFRRISSTPTLLVGVPPLVDGVVNATHWEENYTQKTHVAETAPHGATNANTASRIVMRDASGNFSAGTITASLSGNAATASKWATSRTLTLTGSVTGSGTIDGSGNVSITTSTGHTHVSANITDATNANTANMIVKRDASGNFSAGTITAALSGNASTASKWATARTLTLTGSVTGSGTIDGSGNVSITTSTGHTHVSANITDATNANKANMIVKRDASGNFSAGTITAALSGNATSSSSCSGNAASASKWAAARTITLAGDASGSVSMDGSANGTLTVTVADNSHNHTSANISDATNVNTASKIVKRDASGNFSAGTITAALSGNASSASKWATARKITLSGVVRGNVSMDGSGDVSLSTSFYTFHNGSGYVTELGFARVYRFAANTPQSAIFSSLAESLTSPGHTISCIGRFGTMPLTVVNRDSSSQMRLLNNANTVALTLSQTSTSTVSLDIALLVLSYY